MSFVSRVMALVSLHTLRMGYEGKTVRQLDKYRGKHAYESTCVALALDCFTACGLGDVDPSSDASGALWYDPVLGLQSCAWAVGDGCEEYVADLSHCSQVTQYIAAASCTAIGKDALGSLNVTKALLPVLQSWRRLPSDTTLNVLLAILNVSTVADYQVSMGHRVGVASLGWQNRVGCRGCVVPQPSVCKVGLSLFMDLLDSSCAVELQSVGNLIITNLWRHPVRSSLYLHFDSIG